MVIEEEEDLEEVEVEEEVEEEEEDQGVPKYLSSLIELKASTLPKVHKTPSSLKI